LNVPCPTPSSRLSISVDADPGIDRNFAAIVRSFQESWRLAEKIRRIGSLAPIGPSYGGAGKAMT
jgi:hypothetical protein